MKKYKNILIYVISLFILETLFQVIFYAIRIKYFDSYSHYEKIYKVMLDSLYVLGTLKLVFFLPFYLVIYITFIQRKISLSPIKQSILHSGFFFLLFMFLSLVLPGGFASKVLDTVILTVIPLFTSLSLLSLKRW
jgi:hypothetical protein